MKLNLRFSVISAVAILLCTASFAQGRGNLRGVVKDDGDNILPGAAVFVTGTTLGTSTDINGAFLLQGIPAGETEVSFSYMGYSTQSFRVTIGAGQTENLNVTLSELAHSIEGVTVTAAIDGQQRALNQQKTADHLMQVLSADQIGLFPDLNVADALKRVSGVTSDGSKVSLRGTPDNFTNITVNGEQLIGTSEGGFRAPSLEAIPSDILASMEIQKTLLPSNDGDAIGGMINLRSGEARSLTPKFSVDLGTGYNFLRGKMAYNGKGSYAQRFNRTDKNPNGTFGIAARYSYYNSHSGYDRIEATAWKPYALATINTGGNPAGSQIPVNPDMPLQTDPKEANYNPAKKFWIPTDFRYRYQTIQSIRQGANLVMDWAPTLNTKFVLTGGFNARENDATRYRNRVRFRERDAFWMMDSIPSTQFPESIYGDLGEIEFGESAIGGSRLQNIVQHTDYTENVSNYNINLSGETVVGGWKFDGSVGYSASQSKYRSVSSSFRTPQYRGGEVSAGTGNPAWTPARRYAIGYIPDIHSPYLSLKYLMQPQGETAGMAPDALERYTLYDVTNWDYNTEGDNLTAQLNSSYSHFIGKNASTLSFGVKGKFMGTKGYVPDGMSHIYGYYNFTSNSLAPDVLSLKNMLDKEVLDANFMNGNLVFGYAPSGEKIRKAMQTSEVQALLPFDEYRSNLSRDAYYFDSDERVLAAYVMEKVQFNKLMLLGGLRVEHTSASYKANEIFQYDKRINDHGGIAANPGGQLAPGNRPVDWEPVFDAYELNPRDSTINFTMILPNLQLKYDLNRNTILRFAYTTGYARPNTAYLVPKREINTDMGTVTIGNPNLKAAYAHNLDFLAEHYLANVGLLSGGFFYKNIKKFQFLSQVAIEPGNQYYLEDGNLSVIRQMQNGKRATVYGAEFTLNSTLSFLPGFLKNLVFTGNYTYVHSKATVARMSQSEDEKGADTYSIVDLRLPGQADHTANLALAYSTKRFTLQASYNYMGAYIISLGPDTDQDVWLDGRWQLDLNASVNIYEGLSFWTEAVNVLNQESYQYFGAKNRVYDMRFTGAAIRCGFTYKF